jgi:hypothetical protein
MASSNQEHLGGSGPTSAAPPSGNNNGSKYGGFGSEDIARFGYNNSEQFGAQGVYDPYTKTESISTNPTAPKKEEKKNTAKYDSSSDSSDSDADSDDSEV